MRNEEDREAEGWREAEAYADDQEPSRRAETADDFMTGWRTADRTRRAPAPTPDVRALIEDAKQWRERSTADGSAGLICRLGVALEAAVSTPQDITDAMAEGMARMMFTQTTEGRNGFTWPLNGEWDRERDLERARTALRYVLTFRSKCRGCHATVTTLNPTPVHDPRCFAKPDPAAALGVTK